MTHSSRIQAMDMRYVIRFKAAEKYFCAFHFEIDARIFMAHLRHIDHVLGYQLIDLKTQSVIDEC